jgi:hypothetical protein
MREILKEILEKYPTARASTQFGGQHEIRSLFEKLKDYYPDKKSYAVSIAGGPVVDNDLGFQDYNINSNQNLLNNSNFVKNNVANVKYSYHNNFSNSHNINELNRKSDTNILHN